jgi:hypothetical protein
MDEFFTKEPAASDVADPFAVPAIPPHQSKFDLSPPGQPFGRYLIALCHDPIDSYVRHAHKLIWQVVIACDWRREMNGPRNAFPSPAQSLTLTPSPRTRSHARSGGREFARQLARFSIQFSSPFLLDTLLSSSAVLLDTKPLPTRHSVTSRIRFNSSFYNRLTFSTRHLNRTPENATFR